MLYFLKIFYIKITIIYTHIRCSFFTYRGSDFQCQSRRRVNTYGSVTVYEYNGILSKQFTNVTAKFFFIDANKSSCTSAALNATSFHV